MKVLVEVPVKKVLKFGFDLMVLLLVGGVDGDATKYSCALLWLYLAGGLRYRRCSGGNSLYSYHWPMTLVPPKLRKWEFQWCCCCGWWCRWWCYEVFLRIAVTVFGWGASVSLL
jgi:hypothetical protein